MIALLNFLPGWAKVAAAAALAFAIGLGLGHFRGVGVEKKRQEAAMAVAAVAAIKSDAQAKEKTTAQAVTDAVAVAALTERLTDAVANTPDSVPSAHRVRLNCERMRADPKLRGADLPVACGPSAAGEARPGS